MKEKLKHYGKSLLGELKKDRATGLAAQQAYYYMLALFPLLILMIAIVPYLNIDPQKAINVVNTLLPSQSAELLRDNVVKLVSERNGGLLTFGIIGTLWSASSGMNAFIKAMNIAFDVKETRSFIKARLVSIMLTFGLILAFVVALLLPVFGKVILDAVESIVHIPEPFDIVFNIVRWVVAIVVMAAVLAGLYRVAPNKHYPFKHVIPGAIFATIVWQLISLGFSFYVSNFGNYSATYGSIGGVIVLMLWLFLTGLALVLGGEINAIYHRDKTGEEPVEEHAASVNS
ncbi:MULTISPECIES: YihY/virulence factor BrkB family protein [unclassified Bacillus (in: firmicutes)]|uniref:YihY/virulence factor BrkB family protein n=1 Tax=unclassified Bacillus (in: firmicutes) TaxID=185979 RepID=UPI001BE89636|nr:MULTISPECIES: YihY/virulence factor BrkB family protein [unclassified Bacillus (in: firmicutes)]MBT2639578.1 YihY/virulence factor BrkB family protein [Bacillus sp. ISL-39]MBT2662582.1 YihY/virulence factor BrkB family protein [Bacillus sp. ISL-45]